MNPRRRSQARARMCSRCGASLQPEVQRKYDVFWMILLLCLGSALTIYLVGTLVFATGLWLLSQKKARWICPNCSRGQNSPALSD